MNVNIYQKCDVCDTITRIRVQAGWLEKHPIRYKCGECGISINGEILFNQETLKISYDFKNATEVVGPKALFFIEASGELATRKMEMIQESLHFRLTPFLTANFSMGESMGVFKNVFNSILNVKENEWDRYKRIFELYEIENTHYLVKEINNILPKNIYPCDNELEVVRAVHFLIFKSFNKLFVKNLEDIFDCGKHFLNLDSKEVKKMIEYFSKNNNMLKKFRIKIFEILDNAMNIFNYLIPALGVEYYESEINYEKLGMVTCSFDDLKQFYMDTYEALGDIVLMPVGLDNIYYRKNFETLDQNKNEKLKTLSNLKNTKFKGVKFSFFESNEYLINKANIKVNNRLRNAIGHNDYTYDSITQEILYVPDSSRPNKIEKIYLLEFAVECINLIRGVVYLEEILYQLEKADCMMKGHKPKITVDYFKKKQGRNEKCLCGSGKKFKKCCGKV
ncbi:MAG: SEC-C metal-binding domain-containing protein [Sarcina sp.]